VPAKSPLSGLTVIDVSTMFAGAYATRLLADFGAEVVKVEQPSGDPLRRYGPAVAAVPLNWKVLNRNKLGVVLDLHEPDDRRRLRELAAGADALVESFRPGTLERWELGPDELRADNPSLVVTRISAFGQQGPYARRAGFGTLAEAMSGLAAMSGEPDGAPLLPAFPLGDAATGLHAALATLMALLARERGLAAGQVADVAITEAVISMLGAQISVYDKTGKKPARLGNRSENNAPRNVYRCRDGRWVAVSTSAQPVAERLLRLVGRPDLVGEPWFATGAGRAGQRDLLDAVVGEWVARRDSAMVIEEFERAEAAVAPVYEVDDVLADPHFIERQVTVEVPDGELGSLRMQNVPFRLSATPGAVRRAGPRLGEHTEEVLRKVADDEAPMDVNCPVGVVCLWWLCW
jgi:crotonobetainyl-CoA:carnitine CoA-transferase CaiB-like acyl-CoA transferase